MARNTLQNESDSEDFSSIRRLSRTQLAVIADDTLTKLRAGSYSTHQNGRINLAEDVAFSISNSILYTEDDLQHMKTMILTNDDVEATAAPSSSPKIEIRRCSTLQAAQSLAAEVGEDNVGVLNFASAKNPGGGFIRGSNAQEESIARSSSLYPIVTQPQFFSEFYAYHRRGRNGLYSHRMIYSPRVTIFKDDNGELLSSPYHVAIVTAPAVNAGATRQPELINSTMMERIQRILRAFKMNKHHSLVLGAFGCGVFKNDPMDVGRMFRQHLQSDEFKDCFKRIIFAVLTSENYQVFNEVFTNTAETSLDNDNIRQDQYKDRQNKSKKKLNKNRKHHNYEDEKVE